jgi:hypothetical protein
MTDITYIRTYEGWLYLTVVIDLYSRLVVGWLGVNKCWSGDCSTRTPWFQGSMVWRWVAAA